MSQLRRPRRHQVWRHADLISQNLDAFQLRPAFQKHTTQLFSVGSYAPASCELELTTAGSINQAVWPKDFSRMGPPWKSLRPGSSLGKQTKLRPVTSQTGSDSEVHTHSWSGSVATRRQVSQMGHLPRLVLAVTFPQACPFAHT